MRVLREKLFPQELGQGRVPFQGHHLPGLLGQKHSERAETGADFHHGLLAAKIQGGHNALGLVGVEEKVLAPGLSRLQAQTA